MILKLNFQKLIFTNYPETPMYENYGLLIGGRWQSASDQEIISVMSPVTEQQIGTIPAATREDIERTLVFCHQAGLEWRKTSAWSRAYFAAHS